MAFLTQTRGFALKALPQANRRWRAAVPSASVLGKRLEVLTQFLPQFTSEPIWGWSLLFWKVGVCFFLCEFWQIVSLQELVLFIHFIRSVGIKLFMVFPYYPSNVCGICGDISAFISDISNLPSFYFFKDIIYFRERV